VKLADLQVGQDWTKHNIKALTLRFSGNPANVAQQLYVKVNGIKQAVTVDLAQESWQEVNIDLADFTAKGVALQSVTSLTIGVEGADSFGTVFVDNIRLYPSRCIPAFAPEGDVNGDCVVDQDDLDIVADNWLASGAPLVEYTFDNASLADSSGNGLDGVDVNGVVLENGVLTLNGNNFVDIPFEVSPFDGTTSYSIVMDYQMDGPYTLFSSAHSSEGGDQALAIFVATGENAEPGAVVIDHFWVNLAQAGAGTDDGEWHTAVITYTAPTADSSGGFVVYSDGSPGEPWEVFEDDLPLIPAPELDVVRIGGTLNTSYPYGEEFASDGNLIGSVENVRVFPFAIAADDVARLPDTLPSHPADLNGDGVVDQADKDIVEANLGTETLWP